MKELLQKAFEAGMIYAGFQDPEVIRQYGKGLAPDFEEWYSKQTDVNPLVSGSVCHNCGGDGWVYRGIMLDKKVPCPECKAN